MDSKLILEIKKHIANGKTKEAIEAFMKNTEGEKGYENISKQLFLISSRFHEYKLKERVGTLPVYDNTLAIVNSNLIDLVGNVENGNLNIKIVESDEKKEIKKVDISSTVIEEGVDAANNLLKALVKPPLEEMGLLVADNIKYWRFKNQVKILEKANNYLKKKNVKPQNVPMKILVPLLENASLEEDETLQEKWAALIVNVATDAKFYESNIYPFILGQLSPREVAALEDLKIKGFDLTDKLLEENDLTDANVANLIRLGLIEKGLPKIQNDIARTNQSKDTRVVGNRMSRTGRVSMTPPRNQKSKLTHSRHINITRLGINFIEICSI